MHSAACRGPGWQQALSALGTHRVPSLRAGLDGSGGEGSGGDPGRNGLTAQNAIFKIAPDYVTRRFNDSLLRLTSSHGSERALEPPLVGITESHRRRRTS